MEMSALWGEKKVEVMFVLRSLCRLVLVRVVGCVGKRGSCMYMEECFVCFAFVSKGFAVALWYRKSCRFVMVVTVFYSWPVLAMPSSPNHLHQSQVPSIAIYTTVVPIDWSAPRQSSRPTVISQSWSSNSYNSSSAADSLYANLSNSIAYSYSYRSLHCQNVYSFPITAAKTTPSSIFSAPAYQASLHLQLALASSLPVLCTLVYRSYRMQSILRLARKQPGGMQNLVLCRR
jgi:hypothetical protein